MEQDKEALVANVEYIWIVWIIPGGDEDGDGSAYPAGAFSSESRASDHIKIIRDSSNPKGEEEVDVEAFRLALDHCAWEDGFVRNYYNEVDE